MMSGVRKKREFDSVLSECQSSTHIYGLLKDMNISKLRASNCVSALSAKVLTLGVCCCSMLVLTSCVETFDMQSGGLFGSSVETQNPHWDSGSPPPLVAKDGTPIRVVHKRVKSEALLKEEGVWNLVEQSQSYDPAKAHMAARQKVDTSRRSNDKTLAAHFEPDAKSGQDGKIRLLRLDTGKASYDIYEDIAVSESSFVKPANTVAGAEQLEEITSVFGVQKPILEHDIIPPRKPVSEQAIAVPQALADAVLPPALPERKVGAPKVVEISAEARSVSVQAVPMPGHKPASLRAKTKVIENGDLPPETSVVNKVRAAVHNGRARLVIETKNATRYKVAVDHLRNVLRVKLDRAQLNIDPQGSLSSYAALFGTYVAREKDDGSVLLEVRLKNKSQIIDTVILRPNKSSNHRIVIDMQK